MLKVPRTICCLMSGKRVYWALDLYKTQSNKKKEKTERHLEEVWPVQEEEGWVWRKSCWAPSFPLALPQKPIWSTPPHHEVCNTHNNGECNRGWKRKYCKYLVLKQAPSSIVLSSISRILHIGMIQEVEKSFGGKEQKWNDGLESSLKL